jgi:hypothetical protein
MRKVVVHAAVFVVAMSAPVLAGAMMDHSVVSVMGQPDTGGCSSNCSVGGAPGGTAEGAAQGGYTNLNDFGVSTSTAGTGAVLGGPSTGHSVITAPITGSASGNFNAFPEPGHGHCTGAGSVLCEGLP